MLNTNTIIQTVKVRFLAGKKIFTLTIAIVVIAFTLHAQGTWTQKADFGGASRYGPVGFAIGDKGYMGTGWNGSYLNDFWEYNSNTDSWTQKANVGTIGREMAVGFSIGQKGYIGTGNNSAGVRKDFWEYDQESNTWTQKSDFGGTARWLATGFSMSGKGYLGTGYDGANKKDFWEYDPLEDKWIQKSDLAGAPRQHAVGFSVGGKGFIATGDTGIDVGNKNDLWEYDAQSDSWLQRENFGGSARGSAIAFTVGNKAYVGLGIVNNSNFKSDFWEYDPSVDSWTQVADFGGKARDVTAAFSIGSTGYVGTGRRVDVTFSKDFWQYSPSTCNPPTATITPLGDLDICNMGFVKLQASSGIGYTYQWNRNNVDMPGQVYQTLKAKKPGNYRVRISTGPGCATVSKKVVVYSSCKLNEKTELTSSLSIYPNPTTGTFTLDLQLDDEETTDAEVQVMNMLGQILSIESGELTVDNGKLKTEIQLGDVADGMYMVKVTIGDRVYSAQINLQK
ncbi:MAG: T9SS type A sorting domain-containing protein [Chitinophagales bacterium]|nr:T9SS type A sorting domain-containing protein [Chitinophagales bacterium]